MRRLWNSLDFFFFFILIVKKYSQRYICQFLSSDLKIVVGTKTTEVISMACSQSKNQV